MDMTPKLIHISSPLGGVMFKLTLHIYVIY